MAGPFRRWRPLILVVAVWLLLCYYLFSDNSTQYPAGNQSSAGTSLSYTNSQKHGGGSSGAKRMHWKKLPERYPVTTSLRSLPTGPATVRIPNIQHLPPPQEDKNAKRTRESRLAAVKESFRHSWEGYKTRAWLSDEVTPLTGKRKDPFGGWAATLVDALDTLWIMGMKDDFNEAVKACEYIDFTTTESTQVNVFETTIRYLGGFLAAYELSERHYPVLLLKAVEVAEVLMCAFDTPNRMPITRWPWVEYLNGKPQVAPRVVLVSEIGSLSLEFTKLSELTGEMKYYDAVQHISDYFEKSQKETKLPGMWPVSVDAAKPAFDQDNFFTLGGMSDSLYEYFPKQYLLLGGLLTQPRKLYENFIDVAKKHLFRRALNPDNIPLIVSGDVRIIGEKPDFEVTTIARGQHLTCFAGGMVALGARIFSREDDLEVAKQLTNGCVWSYNITASGIGPEIFHFTPCGQIEDEQTGEKCSWDEQKWRDAVRKHWRPEKGSKAKDGPRHAAQGATKSQTSDQEIDDIIRGQRLPTGVVDVYDKRYILRPEAIESVFILHRITGDPVWMEKAWNMFLHVEMHTRTGIAAAALQDITLAEPKKTDSMESFWLAETLKYFFLVFSDWDLINLDQWVLNTEAHPLRRMDLNEKNTEA